MTATTSFMNPQVYALLWVVLAIVFGVLEGATTELVAIWFALGAVVTTIPALLGFSLTSQLIVFGLVSLVALFFTRPVAVKFLKVRPTKTNADQIIGTIGIVTEDIDNAASKGRVKVGGLSWAARSEDGGPIASDERVLIKEISGVKVIVERVI